MPVRIQHEVEDPELARALTPDYPFFCKRYLPLPAAAAAAK